MPGCPLCEKPDAAYLWPVRESTDFAVFSCPRCQGRFLAPQPTDVFLKDIYSQSYYDAWGLQEDGGAVKKMKISTFDIRLDLLEKWSKNKGAILDVGCATGFFLEAARDRGFTPFGVEFCPYSAKIAKEKFGNDAAFEGILEACPFPDKNFDVIAMSDLLEHVRDPHALLEKTRELLKDDGLVMIMTPNTDSFTQRVMQRQWVHYKLEHLFYFNGTSIKQLAEAHQFRVIHREPATKTLNLVYLYHQFKVYPHWLFTPALSLLNRILPKRFLHRNIRLTIGEMVVLLEKMPVREEHPIHEE